MSIMKHSMQGFWNQQAEWSRATFGEDSVRGPKGPLLHLLKETNEALNEFETNGGIYTDKFHEELIDCFFLIIDAARRSKLTFRELLKLAFIKLEKNKKRKWDPPTSDLPVEHVRNE